MNSVRRKAHGSFHYGAALPKLMRNSSLSSLAQNSGEADHRIRI